MSDKPHVIIYTDGGADPNPGPGGWGALLIAAGGRSKELSGAERATTNNRMELTAALEALRALKRPCRVDFYTDSQYLRRGVTEWLAAWQARGWRRKGDKAVENLDLWQALQKEVARHEIAWHWVKGHAGDAHNERVDRLATAARRKLTGADTPQAFAPQYEIALRVSVPRGSKVGGYAFRVRNAETGTSETHTGQVRNVTSNRLGLEAARAALERTPEGAAVRVYCPDDYLHKGMTQWLAGWQKRRWRTRGGEPVKNREAWQALAQLADARRVQWVLERAHPADFADGLDALASAAARRT